MSPHRVIATLAATAVSSATNALAVLIAAAVMRPSDYGQFSIAVMLSLFLATVCNAVTGEVLLTSRGAKDFRGSFSSAVGGAMAVGLVLYLIYIGASALTALAGEWVSIIKATSVAAPGVIVHNFARVSLFAMQRPGLALVADIVWFSAIILGGLVIWAFGSGFSPFLTIVAWGIGAYLGSLTLLAANVHGPFGRVEASGWLRASWRLGVALSTGSLAMSGAQSAIGLLVASEFGFAAAGGFRFCLTLYGLATVAYSAYRYFVLPNLRSQDVRPLVGQITLARQSALLMSLPLGTCLAVYLGQAVLLAFLSEETFRVVIALSLPFAIVSAGSAVSQGAMVGLRVLQVPAPLGFYRASGGVLIVAFGFAGIANGSLKAVAWGLALAMWITAGLLWVAFIRAVRGPLAVSP